MGGLVLLAASLAGGIVARPGDDRSATCSCGSRLSAAGVSLLAGPVVAHARRRGGARPRRRDALRRRRRRDQGRGWRRCRADRAVLASHGAAFAALQLAFQRGGALVTAGLNTLATNALPIVAGLALFHERVPGGAAGAARARLRAGRGRRRPAGRAAAGTPSPPNARFKTWRSGVIRGTVSLVRGPPHLEKPSKTPQNPSVSDVRPSRYNPAMRRGAMLAAALCSGFVLVAQAGAGQPQSLRFGVADDTGKYAADAGASFFAQLATLGLRDDRMTVTWDPAHPMLIADRVFLDRSITTAAPAACRCGSRSVPPPPVRSGRRPARAQSFATFAASLAKRYPQVGTFVVGNEPNQPRFWQPQFTSRQGGRGGRVRADVADTYDALKAVDPSVTVVGGVLSSRGNDDPAATSNASTVAGALHSRSRRRIPGERTHEAADGQFGFHAYPRSNTIRSHAGSTGRTPVSPISPRVKQALWDAFGGTAQPTIENGLRI